MRCDMPLGGVMQRFRLWKLEGMEVVGIRVDLGQGAVDSSRGLGMTHKGLGSSGMT